VTTKQTTQTGGRTMTTAEYNKITEIDNIEALIESERMSLALARSEGEDDLYIHTDMIAFLKEELHELKFA
jgi:hypothetical protein